MSEKKNGPTAPVAASAAATNETTSQRVNKVLGVPDAGAPVSLSKEALTEAKRRRDSARKEEATKVLEGHLARLEELEKSKRKTQDEAEVLNKKFSENQEKILAVLTEIDGTAAPV